MNDIKQNITGSTRICAVIGDPIEHTCSPMIHNMLGAHLQQDMAYVAFHVEGKTLKEALIGAHALGIKGMNVTMPHKKAVMPYLKRIDEEAKKIGAVNTLVYEEDGYVGYNTDAIGLKTALHCQNFEYKGQDVAIIGSGGAAYASVVAVAAAAKSIHLFNRTKENAEALKAHLQPFYQTPIIVHEWEEPTQEYSYGMVIQTTGMGMGKYEGQMPSCAKKMLRNASYAVDLIYNPEETSFLSYAKEQGCICMNGFDMLFYQAVKAYEYMHGPITELSSIHKVKEKIQSQR